MSNHLDREAFTVISTSLGAVIADHATGRVWPHVAGGADEGSIDVPDDLSTLDETAARELHGRLEARYAELRKDATTREQVEELRVLRAAQAKLVERVNEIAAEQQEIASGLDEVDQPVALPDPAAPAGDTSKAPTADATAPTPASAAAPAGAPMAHAAAVGTDAVLTPPDIGGGPPPPSTVPARPNVGYVAAAGQNEVQAGQPVDFDGIARIANASKGIDGSKGKVLAHLAALPAFEDMGDAIGVPLLSRMASVGENDRMIDEAVADWRMRDALARAKPGEQPRFRDGKIAALPDGRTAAICDPLDIIRTIPDCSMDADPLGDSLPQRPAGRLGFQYTRGVSLSALSGGVTTGWDDAQQALVNVTDQGTWKPCIDIDCPNPEPIRADEVIACVRFDVTTEISNPEWVQDVLSKLAALRVRNRTQDLLAKADLLSSRYTFESAYGYGAFPALVEAAMSVVARGVYAERINPADYNLYLPPGLVETLVTDMVGRAYSDPTARAEAIASVVADVEAVTGLTTVRLWDVVGANPFAALNAPGAAPAALPSLGCEGDMDFTVRFLAPESALFFSTGEERTGLESSPELMRQNKVQWFSREFVGLARHGCHPWFSVDLTLAANGARTGFNEPVPCA